MDRNCSHPLAALLAVDKQFVPTWSPGADPRSAHLPLVSQPGLLAALILGYLLVALLGPRWMETRPAWDVKRPMQAYNAVMTLLSLYMAIELPLAGYANGLGVLCERVRHTRTPQDFRLARAIWLYFFTKIFEFADTVFMVVRKKNSQITFLHVYHHASVAAVWWVVARWLPGGSSYFDPILNCIVHVCMYSYYFLASLGAWVTPYLWWKRHLTLFQIVQFGFLIAHTSLTAAMDCGYPQRFSAFVALYMLSFLVLFAGFYSSAYRRPGMKQN